MVDTELVFIRHGETTANRDRVWNGSMDSALTERGLKQARSVARTLVDFADARLFDAFYTSPLGRTMHTASIISQSLNMDHETMGDLMELSLGAWEGRSLPNLRLSLRLFDMWQRNWEFRSPKGESSAQFDRRVMRTLDNLVHMHRGQRVLLVTHGGVVAHILSNLFGAGPQTEFVQWCPVNCGISEIAHSNSGWTLKRFDGDVESGCRGE